MAKTWLRVGMLFLTLLEASIGVWAAAFPHGFYNSFPTPGRAWLQLFPPFNEHFVRDYGLATLQFAVVLAFATAVLDRRLVNVTLIGFLLFHIGHVAYHAFHLGGADAGAQLGGLIGPPVLGLILLVLNQSVPRDTGEPDGVASAKSAKSAQKSRAES